MSDPGVEYLRHVLAEKGWSAADLARHAGVAHSTINRPLTVKDYPNAISRQTLAKVYAASGVDPTSFLGDAGEPPILLPARQKEARLAGSVALIPVYDISASAGGGSVVAEYEEVSHSLAFPPDYLTKLTRANPRDLAIIGVKGDSMEPTLKDDDIVMLDSSKKNLGYDGLFVVRYDDVLHVKRVMRSSQKGSVTILSDNRAIYPPQEWPADEVEVIGKVIWVGGKV